MDALADANAALRADHILDAFQAFSALCAAADAGAANLEGFAWSSERMGRFDLAAPTWHSLAESDPTDLRARWRALHCDHELGVEGATSELIDWVCEGPAHRGVLMSASTIGKLEWGDRYGLLLEGFEDFPEPPTQVHLPRLFDAIGEVATGDDLAWRLLGVAEDALGPVDTANLAARVGAHERFEQAIDELVAEQMVAPSSVGVRTLGRFLLRPARLDRLRALILAIPPVPQDPMTEVAIAEVLISVGEDRRAADTARRVESTPAAESAPALRLRAWVEAGRGDVRSARHHLRRASWPHTRKHRRALEPATLRALRGTVSPAPAVVIAAMRNEAGTVESYLAHHRGLGFDRFWIVDDGSTDPTRAVLASQRDVDVFESATTFAESANGCSWFATLARRLPPETWISVIDADERLVLPPGFESVEEFLRSLPADVEAVHANVIDVFAGPDGAPWFDDDHVPVGRVGAPFRGLVGGVRYRVLGDESGPDLVKTAFVKAGPFQGLWSTHEVFPVKVASVSVAFVHLKLMNDVSPSLERENWDRRQAERLSRHRHTVAPAPCSVPFRDAEQLAARGLVGAQPPIGAFGA